MDAEWSTTVLRKGQSRLHSYAHCRLRTRQRKITFMTVMSWRMVHYLSSIEGSYSIIVFTELDQTLYSIDPSTPNSSEHRDSAFSYKSPVIFAEKALGAILHGALLYALCCIIGIAFTSLKFEGLLGNRVNWYIVFLPFWGANVLIIIAHFLSFRHAKKLRQWAEVETMENEPLLPLLRRVMMIYSISVPLTGLLFWCELAFCLQLSNEGKTSFYFCYVPLMLIQLAFVARYMLCFAHSSLPVILGAYFSCFETLCFVLLGGLLDAKLCFYPSFGLSNQYSDRTISWNSECQGIYRASSNLSVIVVDRIDSTAHIRSFNGFEFGRHFVQRIFRNLSYDKMAIMCSCSVYCWFNYDDHRTTPTALI